MKKRNDFQWVPSLYIVQGIPYALVIMLSVIFYKTLRVDNALITFYTSLFIFPWFLKPLFAPFLEKLATKRAIILGIQYVMVGLYAALIFSLWMPNYFYWTVALFLIIACFGAMYDVTVDGAYLLFLNKAQQVKWLGIRALSYQIGRLLVQWGLVLCAGVFFHYHAIKISWALTLGWLMIAMLLIALYHQWAVPPLLQVRETKIPTIDVFKQVATDFFAIPQLSWVVLFTLFYSFPDNQLAKIVPLFLLDSRMAGGLQQSTIVVSMIGGFLTITAMLIGVTFSSVFLARMSLSYYLIIMTSLSVLTKVSYYVMSLFPTLPLTLVGGMVIVEQLVYGLCNGGYMLYLLRAFGQSRFPMTLYAIGTSLMGLGVMFAGGISGYLQQTLGYPLFFLWIIVSNSVIGLITVYFFSKKAGFTHDLS